MSVLDEIIARRKECIAEMCRSVPRRELERRAEEAPPVRDFAGALGAIAGGAPMSSGSPPRIIAEFKRRSPSAGAIGAHLDPARYARACESGGAAGLSVLTEPDFFDGSEDDLVLARAATSLPVLRKDFIITEEQVLESRAMGADAILLIASLLDSGCMVSLLGAARAWGMEALVETHDEAQIDAALRAGATIVGVNSRDLTDFSVDLRRCEALGRRIPDGVIRVAESGIKTLEDVLRLRRCGFSVLLIGETLARSEDPQGAVSALISSGGGPAPSAERAGRPAGRD